jgi:hypothetical protein
MAVVPSELARAAPTASPLSHQGTPGHSSGSLAWWGYLLAAGAVAGGWWYTRGRPLVDAEQGLGYWLGIAGGTLMATLLLYPVRKRLRSMSWLGPIRHWFRMHMVFGVVGPVLILYHSNFSFGSLNDTVALACTLLVALSGLIGRYVHAKVYVDLDGHRATLEELRGNARITALHQREAVALVPGLLQRLSAYDALVLAAPESTRHVLLLPLKLGVATRLEALRLSWFARRQIDALAARSDILRARRAEVRRSVRRFIHDHMRRVRRVAALQSYERLFSIWHVFHLPFFYMLVVAALIHVLAVHMY